MLAWERFIAENQPWIKRQQALARAAAGQQEMSL